MDKNTRFHALDSLRGIGALLVLTIHCLQKLELADYFRHTPFRLLVNGRSLVMFFFVLSGFVLTMGLLHSRQKNNYTLYLKRRMARIYLPFAGTAVMAWLCITFLPAWPMQGDLIGYLLLSGTAASLAPNPLAWSLVYELRVSLFIPFLCWLAWNYERRTGVMMFFLFIFETIAVFWLGIGQFPYGSDTFAGAVVLTTRYMICIYIGIWLAKCITEKRPWLEYVKDTWVPVLGVIAYGLMSILLDEPGTLGSFFIIVLVFRSAWLRKVLDSPFSLWLARISYSLYLTHFIVVTFVMEYLPVESAYIRAIVAFFTAFAFAELYQRCVEAPSIKLSRSIK